MQLQRLTSTSAASAHPVRRPYRVHAFYTNMCFRYHFQIILIQRTRNMATRGNTTKRFYDMNEGEGIQTP